MDRTAGGIGGAAPASLDSYGQSRKLLSHLLGNGIGSLKIEALDTKGMVNC